MKLCLINTWSSCVSNLHRAHCPPEFFVGMKHYIDWTYKLVLSLFIDDHLHYAVRGSCLGQTQVVILFNVAKVPRSIGVLCNLSHVWSVVALSSTVKSHTSHLAAFPEPPVAVTLPWGWVNTIRGVNLKCTGQGNNQIFWKGSHIWSKVLVCDNRLELDDITVLKLHFASKVNETVLFGRWVFVGSCVS